MARADLLLALARAALTGDSHHARAVIEAITAEEAQKRHTVLANRLIDELRRAEDVKPLPVREIPTQAQNANWLREVMPKRRLEDLALPTLVRKQLERLVEEQNRAELLRSYGLEPRHTVLLVGPSGNGKTSCAEAIAAELALPLLVLRYERIITSYLGETATRLEEALEDVRRRHCVLFLDEFDVVGKERADEHETGEVKRIVSSLLLQLDRLPSHVVLVAATNHAQILDSAVWRRFEMQLELPAPDKNARLDFAHSCITRMRLDLTSTATQRLLRGLGGTSYADIEGALLELRRRQVLAGPDWDTKVMSGEISEILQVRGNRVSDLTRQTVKRRSTATPHDDAN